MRIMSGLYGEKLGNVIKDLCTAWDMIMKQDKNASPERVFYNLVAEFDSARGNGSGLRFQVAYSGSPFSTAISVADAMENALQLDNFYGFLDTHLKAKGLNPVFKYQP
jgi:hypothetical protein